MIGRTIERREFGRRQVCCGAVATIAILASRPVSAQAIAFTPEGFGAAGDGRRDDYPAFARLVGAVSAARGGTVRLAPGRTYRLDRYIGTADGAVDLIFDGCEQLTIEGEGATIQVRGDFRRSARTIRGLSGLWIQNSRNVVVRNVELDGNVEGTARAPTLSEGATHGLHFRSCSDVMVDNVYAHHFAGDGMFVRESNVQDSTGRRRASRRFTVRNSRFFFNARQGLTVGQLRSALFEGCEFSFTGYVDESGRIGRYGGHSPAAGVDIEPNNTPGHGDPIDVQTGDLLFRNCRVKGNYGPAFLAAKYARGQPFLDRVRLENCHLECNDGLTGGRDGFIFDVPGGEVIGCELHMRDKTAYLGWNQHSDASPRFVSNTVSGRNLAPGHPLLELRPTRGAPLVEGNRFVGHAPPGSELRMVVVRNPRAIVRNNQMLLATPPAE